MSLYPVTKQMIWQMVENERKLGGPFSLQGAIASHLYNLITGTEMSQRAYCKTWGWTYKQVRMKWEQITTTTALMYENSEGRTKGALGAQKPPESDEKEVIRAHEGRTKGAHIQNNTISNLDLSANLEGGGKPQGRTGAREEPPPPAPDDGPVPFVSDDLGWLPENDQVYAPTITELLATYRPTAGDQLLTHTWRQHSRVPFSSIAALIRDYPWPVFVAGVVIAADDRRPNLKFLQSILRRLNDEYSRPKSPAGEYGRCVEVRDGIPVYDLTARTGGALPAGVSAGRNGGARQTGRRNPDFKRPSERSWDEHLRACGIDPAELAPGTPDYDLPFGPHRAAGGPGDGQTLPIRPLLRLRA